MNVFDPHLLRPPVAENRASGLRSRTLRSQDIRCSRLTIYTFNDVFSTWMNATHTGCRPNALIAFECAARDANFTLAAREMRTSQSAVSRHIGQLETWLAARLFERSRAGATLTDAGERFRDGVAAGLDAIRRAAASRSRAGASSSSSWTESQPAPGRGRPGIRLPPPRSPPGSGGSSPRAERRLPAVSSETEKPSGLGSGGGQTRLLPLPAPPSAVAGPRRLERPDVPSRRMSASSPTVASGVVPVTIGGAHDSPVALPVAAVFALSRKVSTDCPWLPGIAPFRALPQRRASRRGPTSPR